MVWRERCKMRCDNDVLTWRYPSPPTPPITNAPMLDLYTVQFSVCGILHPYNILSAIFMSMWDSLDNLSIVWLNTVQYNVAGPLHIKADDTVTLNIVSWATG